MKKINLLSLLTYLCKTLPIKAALDLEIPYNSDINGFTPFHYCLETNNYDCINYIYQKMQVQKIILDYKCFEYAITFSGECSKVMLAETLFTQSPVLDNLSIPVVGIIRGNRSEKLFLSDEREIH